MPYQKSPLDYSPAGVIFADVWAQELPRKNPDSSGFVRVLLQAMTPTNGRCLFVSDISAHELISVPLLFYDNATALSPEQEVTGRRIYEQNVHSGLDDNGSRAAHCDRRYTAEYPVGPKPFYSQGNTWEIKYLAYL